MPAPILPLWRSALVPAVLVVLGGLVAVAVRQRPVPARPAMIDMTGWEMADLIRHLEGREVGLRAVPTWEGGIIGINAFLVRGEKPWEELARLSKNPACLGQWKGVVYCERVPNEDTADSLAECWGDAHLRIAPFVFFGDPQLVGVIRDALRKPGAAAGTEGEGADDEFGRLTACPVPMPR
jgi:hypothetical protein